MVPVYRGGFFVETGLRVGGLTDHPLRPLLLPLTPLPLYYPSTTPRYLNYAPECLLHVKAPRGTL